MKKKEDCVMQADAAVQDDSFNKSDGLCYYDSKTLILRSSLSSNRNSVVVSCKAV